MSDTDQALMLLENKVRRDILQHLVREPHYPLQLAELIGVSQQAVMKHLKVLEKAGFVDSEMVPSEKGGPPKRIYLVKQSFSMRIDVSRRTPLTLPARAAFANPGPILSATCEIVTG